MATQKGNVEEMDTRLKDVNQRDVQEMGEN